MKKDMNRLIRSVIFGLVTINTVIQADAARPRLVVGIVVDQLRTDYIEYLQTYFGEKGFKRLMRDGAYFRDVDFNARHLDAPSSTALLLTGAYPSATGVAAASFYDPASKSVRYALTDKNTLGNFTDDSYSPSSLRLSTLADELEISSNGRSAVYALATDPQQALILAGHAAEAGAWIDDNSGNWATTTYFKELPSPLSARNYSSPLSQRIDTMTWVPSRSIGSFPGLPPEQRATPFKHSFSRKRYPDAFARFEASPLANREITDAAIECINELKLGKNPEVTDMLNLAYSAAPYSHTDDGDNRAELLDTYFTLDAQLGRLFEAIDRKVGLDNTLIWVSSTGYFNDNCIDDSKYRIPGGEFSTKRAKSLLNAYFSAKYGNGDYVEAFHNGHIYLNHRYIESKNLSTEALALEAGTFMCRMSGVADAFTLSDILSPATPEQENLRLTTDPQNSGDVIVTFSPGWTLTEDIDYPSVSKPIRSSMIMAPAFILSNSVNAETIITPVEAVQIAPTIAGILRIRAPNGSYAKPVL